MKATLWRVAMVMLILTIGSYCYWRIQGYQSLTKVKENWPTKEIEEKTGAAFFAAMHHEIRTQDGAESPGYLIDYQYQALRKAIVANKNRIRLREPLPWVERGPGNVAGRARGILVDPTDSTHQTWFVGSVSGGVWKTTNAGVQWRHLTNGLPGLATSYLAMSSNNPDVIYLGTGEGYTSLDVVGNGVWKSTDRGESWEQLPSTAGDDSRFGHIMRIVVNPKDENEVLICTRRNFRLENEAGEPVGYIFKSMDGGITWNEVFQGPTAIQQLLVNPENFNTIYASANSLAILKSVDGGQNWDTVFDAEGRSIERMELAIAPSDTSRVYISAESRVADLELFMTINGGSDWEQVFGEGESNNFGPVFSGQGWYDNTIAVNPYNADEVFVGGAGPIVRINVQFSEVLGVALKEVILEADYLAFANLGTLGEGVIKGPEAATFFGLETNLNDDEFSDIEVLFGPGIKQRVHRFNFTANESTYQEFIEMPIEAWDVERNRQLSISFIDLNNDGQLTIEPDQGVIGVVEPIIIHSIDYNALFPNVAITANPFHKATTFMILASNNDTPVDLNAVDNGKIFIDFEPNQGVGSQLGVLTDGYEQYRSRFPEVGTKGVHVDHHNLLFIPIDSATQQFYILNANDGGVAFSTNSGESFVQTGGEEEIGTVLKGMNTAQFYGVDKANGIDRYVGGTQDNGSWVSSVDPDQESNWSSAPGGDGFEAAWNYGDPNLVLESSQFNGIFKSTNGGRTWRFLDIPGDGPFLTRIANSKQDPNLVFAVSDLGVLRSADFGDSWEVIEMADSWSFSPTLGPPIEISLNTPSIIWTGRGMTEERSLQVSTDGGFSFNPTNNYTQAKLGSITGIATDPTNPGIAYALFSQANGPKVLKTEDLGTTWMDISGFETNREESTNGFPDVATYSLLVMPFDPNRLWAGTEIGLFESLDGGISWQFADNGLPAVGIWEMKIVNDEVVLATHGRGVWSVSLPELMGYEPPEAITPPVVSLDGDAMNGQFSGLVSMNSQFDSLYLSVRVPVGPSDTMLYSQPLANSSDSIIREQAFAMTIDNLPDGQVFTATVSVEGFLGGLRYLGFTNGYTYQVESAPVGALAEDFESDLVPFAHLEFDVGSPPGFVDNGLQSPHPYRNLTTQFSVLQRPLLLNEGGNLSFDEVVIVEPGEDLAAVEAATEIDILDFYDYVTIEGTSDFGQTWEPILYYDSRNDPDWLNAYDFGEIGTPDLLKRREIDLLTAFEPTDTIYLRFRLTSDPFVTGWGWYIDNLQFNEAVTSTEGIEPMALDWSIFPNPASNILTIQYDAQLNRTIQIHLFNADGQLIRQQQWKPLEGDAKSVEWNIRNLTPGTYWLSLKDPTGMQSTKRVVVVP